MSCVFLSIFSEQTLSYNDYAMIVIMTNVLCLCIPAIPSGSIFVVLIISNMANIRIDADGLQNNISSMRAYINELDSLNARTQTLMTQIASSWEGEASTAYINIMTERIQKAGQMKELLQEFISYMESTRTKFVSRDQESSYSIRGC